MEGNASKEAMYRIFGQAPTPDSEMTYNEQRKLAMWVCSAILVPLPLISLFSRSMPSVMKCLTPGKRVSFCVVAGDEFTKGVEEKGLSEGAEEDVSETIVRYEGRIGKSDDEGGDGERGHQICGRGGHLSTLFG